MSLHRVYNFSAGPATLPLSVLEQAQQEMLDWRGTGISVMELSHRGETFLALANEITQDLREVMAVPQSHHILFLSGGATTQFSSVAMNLLGKHGKADYANTGIWSDKAIKEASRYLDAHVAVKTNIENGLVSIPAQSTWSVRDNIDYFHYTTNETIDGVMFDSIPDLIQTPLVADMSSNILSEPVDVARFGVIYAGAQKNMGPAGITTVIVRDDCLHEGMPQTPSMLSYQKQVEAESMLNTPPTFNWYIVGLVLKWVKEQGGLDAMAKLNAEKAQLLYDCIDSNDFYQNPVAPQNRSRMNVPFTLADATLDSAFLKQAREAGLTNLKGHRLVGGMRASIYNAMPIKGVQALVSFMNDFAKREG